MHQILADMLMANHYLYNFTEEPDYKPPSYSAKITAKSAKIFSKSVKTPKTYSELLGGNAFMLNKSNLC